VVHLIHCHHLCKTRTARHRSWIKKSTTKKWLFRERLCRRSSRDGCTFKVRLGVIGIQSIITVSSLSAGQLTRLEAHPSPPSWESRVSTKHFHFAPSKIIFQIIEVRVWQLIQARGTSSESYFGFRILLDESLSTLIFCFCTFFHALDTRWMEWID
jgi:hypothetical protein